jgi:ABC-type taurine transport system ATPase subunit
MPVWSTGRVCLADRPVGLRQDHAAAGDCRPGADQRGQVLVNGVSPHDARLARAYGYVFQAPALFPWRTVLGNVMLPLQIQGGESAQNRSDRAGAAGACGSHRF